MARKVKTKEPIELPVRQEVITEEQALAAPYIPNQEEDGLEVGDDLSPQQDRFVTEYMQNFDSYKSAIIAGYSPWYAKTASASLLRNPKVRAEVNRRKIQDRDRYADLDDKIIRSWERLAFYDPKGIFNDDGSLKPISEIDDDVMFAIEGIDTEVKLVGRGQDAEEVKVTKVRTSRKLDSLRDLAKHRGLFEADNKRIIEIGFKGILAALPEEQRESVKLALMKRLENAKK